MKIVVVSPHRDDAAFSLGLSAEAWLAAGHTVHILNCFTRSVYAPYSDADSLHENDRTSFVSALRKREDIAWNKLMGSKLQITDLDLLDAPLRLACGADEVLQQEVRAGDRAAERIAGALAKLARAGCALAVPLALGGHIDHRVTREAALAALRTSPFPAAFYEDLPYAARPGGADGILSGALALDVGLQEGFAEGETADRGSRIQRKRRMVECYDSQIDSDAVEQIASFPERYGGRERLWCNSLWRSAPGLVAEGISA